MLFLNIFVTVVTAVIVNGFKKRIISPQYLVLSTFNSAARELDRPLEILKEISAECSARDLNILATKLISRCSAHSYLRKCDDIYEYVRSVSEPDSRLQTTLMSAYIR